MKGTFTGTGRLWADNQPSTYIRGGKEKEGLLVLDFGTGTVSLEVSIDGGTSWVIESSYTADTVKHVKFPDPDAIYTLNCSAYTADIEYSLKAS